MIIDIKTTTIGIKIKKRILILLLIVMATIFLVLNFYQKTFFGITGVGYIAILSGVLILYLLLGIARDYHYFYFSDQSLKLTFRYYSITSFFRKPTTIEIKKETFFKFQIEKSLLGLKKYLVLYQKTAKGIAKYPPISISLLKKDELQKLSESLLKLSQQ